MNREVHVRFWEGVGVKFSRATQRSKLRKSAQEELEGYRFEGRAGEKQELTRENKSLYSLHEIIPASTAGFRSTGKGPRINNRSNPWIPLKGAR